MQSRPEDQEWRCNTSTQHMTSPSPVNFRPLIDTLIRITAVAGMVIIFLSLLSLLTFITR
jgi:hypothetical protein